MWWTTNSLSIYLDTGTIQWQLISLQYCQFLWQYGEQYCVAKADHVTTRHNLWLVSKQKPLSKKTYERIRRYVLRFSVLKILSFNRNKTLLCLISHTNSKRLFKTVTRNKSYNLWQLSCEYHFMKDKRNILRQLLHETDILSFDCNSKSIFVDYLL